MIWAILALFAGGAATYYYTKSAQAQAAAQAAAGPPPPPTGVTTCTWDKRHGGAAITSYPCPGRCPSTWSDAEWYAYGQGWADVKGSKAAEDDFRAGRTYGTTPVPSREAVLKDMIDNYSNLPSSAGQRMTTQNAKDAFFNGFNAWWPGAYDAEFKWYSK